MRSPTPSSSRTFARRRAASSKGRTTCRSSKGRSRLRTTPSASARSAIRRRCSSRSAHARPPAASRHCATSQTSTSSSRRCTRRPSSSRRSNGRPRSPNHVHVDFELHGCPIDKRQLLEVVTAFLHGRKPEIPSTSVCTECKQRGIVCVTVAHGTPCLGPVTHAGCGALCPSFTRGCFGCFGPMETPNIRALLPLLRGNGLGPRDVERVFSTFSGRHGAFPRGCGP